MSNNNYKINPCKSCRQNYDLTDINSINQCCYNTLAAFEGKTSLNSFRNSPEVMNCQKCILDSMESIDRTPCDLRMTQYPQWIQAPHYFPGFLSQEDDVATAKKMCLSACESNKYPNECALNCKIDSDAVEQVENYTLNTKKYGVRQNILQTVLSNDYIFILFYVILSIVGIYIFIFILHFLKIV